MAEVDWSAHSNDEIIASVRSAPRIFGPWEHWGPPSYADDAGAWLCREIFPGPSYSSAGTVYVQPHTGCPGFSVLWHRDGKRISESFATSEEAKAHGDAWLREAGCRRALESEGVERKGTP